MLVAEFLKGLSVCPILAVYLKLYSSWAAVLAIAREVQGSSAMCSPIILATDMRLCGCAGGRIWVQKPGHLIRYVHMFTVYICLPLAITLGEEITRHGDVTTLEIMGVIIAAWAGMPGVGQCLNAAGLSIFTITHPGSKVAHEFLVKVGALVCAWTLEMLSCNAFPLLPYHERWHHAGLLCGHDSHVSSLSMMSCTHLFTQHKTS